MHGMVPFDEKKGGDKIDIIFGYQRMTADHHKINQLPCVVKNYTLFEKTTPGMTLSPSRDRAPDHAARKLSTMSLILSVTSTKS